MASTNLIPFSTNSPDQRSDNNLISNVIKFSPESGHAEVTGRRARIAKARAPWCACPTVPVAPGPEPSSGGFGLFEQVF
jgi:hypothetical protein